MMDYTDRHFRVVMRQVSRHALLYTEMVVAQALHHGRRDTLLGFDPLENPLLCSSAGMIRLCWRKPLNWLNAGATTKSI